jgi:hypothetical protein
MIDHFIHVLIAARRVIVASPFARFHLRYHGDRFHIAVGVAYLNKH